MSTYMIYVNLYEDIYGDIRRFMSTYTREIASLHYVRLLHDGNSAAAEMGIEAAKTFPIQILMIVFILKQILMVIFIFHTHTNTHDHTQDHTHTHTHTHTNTHGHSLTRVHAHLMLILILNVILILITHTFANGCIRQVTAMRQLSWLLSPTAQMSTTLW